MQVFYQSDGCKNLALLMVIIGLTFIISKDRIYVNKNICGLVFFLQRIKYG